MTKKIWSVISITVCAVLCALCIPQAAVAKADTANAAIDGVTAYASERAAENGWQTAPNIMRWPYGGFIAEQNVIVAQPLYLANDGESDALVHFSLLDGQKNVLSVPVTDADGGFSAKLLDDIKVVKSVSADLGEYYVIDDAQVIDGLNMLPAGKYYLRAWVEATAEYSAIADTDVMFNILRARNTWDQTPYVLPWDYGEYDIDVNKITAEPRFCVSYGDITYTVTTDAEGSEYPAEALRAFNVDGQTGMVEPTVAAAFTALDVGDYYLKAVVDGSDDYYPLESPVYKFTVARAQNDWVGELPHIASWRLGDFDSELNMPVANAKHGYEKIVIRDVRGAEPQVYYDNTDDQNIINTLADMRPGRYIMTVTVDATAQYSGIGYSVDFEVFDAENIFLETDGMPWWGVLLCIVGAFGVFVLILFILHQTGVLRMISSRMLASIRAKADIDATIASVRAGRITAFAQRTYEQLNAHDEQQQALAAAQEEERLALESARIKEERKAARRAAALAAAARTPEEKAASWEKKAAAMKERANALKVKAKQAEEKAAKIISESKPAEEREAQEVAAAKKKPRTPEEKAAALEEKAREAQERAESLRARAEVMRDIAAARAEKAREKAAKQQAQADAAPQEPETESASASTDDRPDSDNQ